MTTAETTSDTPRLGLPALDVKPDPDDTLYWSVTSIIGVLDRPALMYWAAEQTAIAALSSQATWQGMLADCDDACRHDNARDCQAIKWLRDARFRRPRNVLSAAETGTVVHALAETYALTGIRPDRDAITREITSVGASTVDLERELPVVTAMLDRFDGWLQRAGPSYQATEVAVFSPTFGYAGTADAFLSVGGVRFIADYKTTRDPTDSRGKAKTPYPEVALQLAAYRHAEVAAVWRPRRTEKMRRRYYALSAAEQSLGVPVPEVDAGLVIHITPEACEAYPVRCDEQIHRSFLFVQEAARWSLEQSQHVVGDRLEYEEEA